MCGHTSQKIFFMKINDISVLVFPFMEMFYISELNKLNGSVRGLS